MSSSAQARLTVGLIQITEPMDELHYLPYSIGLLQTYVEAHGEHADQMVFLPPTWLREPRARILPRLASADVLGFSVHVWNYRYTLALAAAAKAQRPDCLILFGGPHVPDQAEAFLRAHPFIDLAVHGEGEESFRRILDRRCVSEQSDWSDLRGISYLDAAGRFHAQGKGERVRELDRIPSPYLTGYFDPLLAAYPEHRWVAVWESNRGCPFSCTFCDWGTINSKVLRFELERLQAEIDWFGSHGIEYVYCADANFGILPRDIDLARRLIHARMRYGYPQCVLVQMTKNQTERAFTAFKELTDAGMLPKIPLSLQSVNPEVLKHIKRDNISQEMYHELLKRFTAAGISTYTDILVGLPGETYQSFSDGISSLITQGQHGDVRFWNAYLLPNAEMSQPDYRRRFGLGSVEIPYLVPFSEAIAPLDGVQEMLEMVVETDTMPRSDWVRMRSLAWMTQILYFSGFLQPALLLVHGLAGVPHREMLRVFFEAPLPPEAQIIAYLRRLLITKAEAILTGEHEFMVARSPVHGKQVYLPTQAFVMTELLNSPYLQQVYGEAHLLLEGLLRSQQRSLPPDLLKQALLLSYQLFVTQLPSDRFELQLSYNLYGCFQAMLRGQPPQLQSGRWRLCRRPDAMGQLEIAESALEPAQGN